jgi:hypothetical protein
MPNDEFRYFTPEAKAGVLLIRSMNDDAVLDAARNFMGPSFKLIDTGISNGLHPRWTHARCIEEALNRQLIDVCEFDRLMGSF